MTTTAYHAYADEMVGHMEVEHQTVDETIAAITAKRNAAVYGRYVPRNRDNALADFRKFSAEMNTSEVW